MLKKSRLESIHPSPSCYVLWDEEVEARTELWLDVISAIKTFSKDFGRVGVRDLSESRKPHNSRKSQNTQKVAPNSQKCLLTLGSTSPLSFSSWDLFIEVWGSSG